jgi:hypothetical protein
MQGKANQGCHRLGKRWGLFVPLLAACTAPGCTRISQDTTQVTAAIEAAPETMATKLSLTEEQRQYLWQIEHFGNVLVKHGFGAIKLALTTGDAQALASFLAGDFTGATYAEPSEVRLSDDFVEVARRQDAGQSRLPLDPEQFVQLLLSYRRNFGRPPRVAMNLMRLAPDETDNLNSPYWRGSCLLRLWGDAASPGRPTEITLTLEYRIRKPTEETLKQKGWLQSAALTQSVVGRARQFLFREVTRERGLDPSLFHDNWTSQEKITITGGVFLSDFNRDGILDLLVTDLHGYFLYKGLPGGKFIDVTREMGLSRSPSEQKNRTVAAFVDLDGDGWEDLILGDHIYRNEQGRRFVDYTFRTNLRVPADAGGIALADYDRDGRVDLYVTHPGKGKKDSWLGGKSGDTMGNQLWRNRGNWRFEDVTESTGTSGNLRSTFSAVWLDANNDGWPDLYVINEFGNGVLLVNQGNGIFREQQLAQGPSDFGTMGITCGDIDNDGNIDLYCANMYSKAGSRVIGNLKPATYPEEVMAKMRQFVAGSQLWRNRGALQFERIGQRCQVAAVGWAYGAALADLDNDGWLDLYATAGFMSSSRDEPDG